MININVSFDQNKPEDVTVTCGKTIISIKTIKDDKSDSIEKPTIENKDPNERFDSSNINHFDLLCNQDVDKFCEMFNHDNNYINHDGIKLSLGDEIFINDGRFNKTWLVAGFDCEHNRVASDNTIYDNGYGIFLIPKTSIDNMYWNSNNITAGGYLNSEIHNNINSSDCDSIRGLLNNHIIQRNVLLSNAISGNNANNYVWSKAYMTLMSIGQMTGTFAQNNNSYDDGEANYKLPLFNFIGICVPNEWFWSRNIDGSLSAWGVYGDGSIGRNGVYLTRSVRPLMMIR